MVGLKPGALGASIAQRTRNSAAARALGAPSRFVVGSVRDLTRLVLQTKPTTLARHENELAFLIGELERVREKDITALGWLDFFESFQSLVALRARIVDPCCQAVLAALVTDRDVTTALSMAYGLSTIANVEAPPSELLKALKAGPGKHLKQKGYAYRRKCDLEITRIRRVRDLQMRGIALLGTVIASALVGLSGYLFDQLPDELF